MTRTAKPHPTYLRTFYAVTETSVYQVRAVRPWVATAVKIAVQGRSKIPLHDDICQGGMIAIGKNLQAFIPEGGGLSNPYSAYERHLENVTSCWWGAHTSDIVALFRTKVEALSCFSADNLQPLDPRWVWSTRAVLQAIGEEHPSFSICHYGDRELMPLADMPAAPEERLP